MPAAPCTSRLFPSQSMHQPYAATQQLPPSQYYPQYSQLQPFAALLPAPQYYSQYSVLAPYAVLSLTLMYAMELRPTARCHYVCAWKRRGIETSLRTRVLRALCRSKIKCYITQKIDLILWFRQIAGQRLQRAVFYFRCHLSRL